jgi:hypothetical protein
MRPDETDVHQPSASINRQLLRSDTVPKTIDTMPKTAASDMRQTEPQRSLQANSAGPNLTGLDLVGQLQKAVRDEMRRIMEVCWSFFLSLYVLCMFTSQFCDNAEFKLSNADSTIDR